MIDRHGQPPSAFNAGMRVERNIDELIGICKGVVADGMVVEEEAHFLRMWLDKNRECRDIWPANVLYARLGAMLADNKFEGDEERELLTLLLRISGGNPEKLDAQSLSTGLPINEPVPKVEISGRKFCFTGRFIFGARNQCEAEIVRRGGQTLPRITRDLNFLVIGIIGSRDWIHSTHGRKIEKAVEYRSSGNPLAIIAEEHFINALT